VIATLIGVMLVAAGIALRSVRHKSRRS
jgi:hypothetical protein